MGQSRLPSCMPPITTRPMTIVIRRRRIVLKGRLRHFLFCLFVFLVVVGFFVCFCFFVCLFFGFLFCFVFWFVVCVCFLGGVFFFWFGFFFFFFWFYNLHCAVNCLQHVRSNDQDVIVCKSRATYQALITCNMSCARWYEGKAQLLSLTEYKSHLYVPYLIG